MQQPNHFRPDPESPPSRLFLKKKSGSNFFRKFEILKSSHFVAKLLSRLIGQTQTDADFFRSFVRFGENYSAIFFRLPIFFRHLHRTRNSFSRNADDRFFRTLFVRISDLGRSFILDAVTPKSAFEQKFSGASKYNG